MTSTTTIASVGSSARGRRRAREPAIGGTAHRRAEDVTIGTPKSSSTMAHPPSRPGSRAAPPPDPAPGRRLAQPVRHRRATAAAARSAPRRTAARPTTIRTSSRGGCSAANASARAVAPRAPRCSTSGGSTSRSTTATTPTTDAGQAIGRAAPRATARSTVDLLLDRGQATKRVPLMPSSIASSGSASSSSSVGTSANSRPGWSQPVGAHMALDLERRPQPRGRDRRRLGDSPSTRSSAPRLLGHRACAARHDPHLLISAVLPELSACKAVTACPASRP